MSKTSLSVCGRTQVKRVARISVAFVTVLFAAGCSSGVDRLASASFGSGYDDGAPAPLSPAETAQAAPSRPIAPAAAPKEQGAKVMLASASPDAPTAGYLSAARVDLPPLAESAPPRVRTADGYGRYNKRRSHDGYYDGPRVITPYGRPHGHGPIINGPDEELIIEDGPGAYGKGPYKPSHYERDYGPKHDGPKYGGHKYDKYDGAKYDGPKYDKYDGGKYDDDRPDYDKRPGPGYGGGYKDDEPDYGDRGPYGKYDGPGPRGKDYAEPRHHKGSPGPYDDDDGPEDKYDGPEDKYPDHASLSPGRAGGKIVKVEPGDTLFALAIRHGTTVRAIVETNGLPSDVIHIGQEIIIPGHGPVAYAATVKPEERQERKARQEHKERRHASRPGGPRCVETGQCHVVEAGESLGSIARRHGVGAIDILEANGLNDPRQLKPGHVLSIPERKGAANKSRAPYQKGESVRERYAARNGTVARDGSYPPPGEVTSTASSKAYNSVKTEDNAPSKRPAEAKHAAVAAEPVTGGDAEKTCEAALANPLPRSGRTFRQPAEGLLIQKFGAQADGAINEGINISVPKGTPIKAAENGVVAYVGNELSGFGNLILVRHADDYVTAYAHTEEVQVKRCEVVKRGQQIATAGATGDVSQPQLHFEIRRASKPVDPTTMF